jgi:hypothetical protein
MGLVFFGPGRRDFSPSTGVGEIIAAAAGA